MHVTSTKCTLIFKTCFHPIKKISWLSLQTNKKYLMEEKKSLLPVNLKKHIVPPKNTHSPLPPPSGYLMISTLRERLFYAGGRGRSVTQHSPPYNPTLHHLTQHSSQCNPTPHHVTQHPIMYLPHKHVLFGNVVCFVDNVVFQNTENFTLGYWKSEMIKSMA